MTTAPDTTRPDFETALAGVDNMIYRTARKFAKTCRWDEAQIQDAAQAARIALWKAYPKWNPARGKWSSLSHVIITHAMCEVARTAKKKKKKQADSFTDISDEFREPSRTCADDRKIERLAIAIQADPRKFGFTRPQSDAIKAFAASGPQTEARDVAAELGYERASSLSMLMARIRKRCKPLIDNLENLEV